MTLLDQHVVNSLLAVADARVGGMVDALRQMNFAGAAPAGMKRMETLQEKGLFAAHLARQSNQEQAGVVPGHTASSALTNPLVMQHILSAFTTPPPQTEPYGVTAPMPATATDGAVS